jgi:hypothetical protein
MTDSDSIYSDEMETQKRVSICISCEKNILDVIPKCSECNCSISILTTLNFKTCPIGKW